MYRDAEAAADDILGSTDDNADDVGVGALRWIGATLALLLTLQPPKIASNITSGSVDTSSILCS